MPTTFKRTWTGEKFVVTLSNGHPEPKEFRVLGIFDRGEKVKKLEGFFEDKGQATIKALELVVANSVGVSEQLPQVATVQLAGMPF